MVIVTIIIFILLLLLRVPIAYVLGITTISYIIISGSTNMLITVPQRLFSGLESYSLLAIPLFMMAGEVMNKGGITRRLVQFAQSIVGHFKGGLAYVNVIANMLLASIIGSATAQIAMMSRTIVPEMAKEGYDRNFSVATTASAGLLGPIIPPSMMFIIYGVASGTSIGTMFLAGIMPGILLSFAFAGVIAYIGYKQKWQGRPRRKVSDMLRSFIVVVPALLVPVVIVVGILSGAFTPTESAAVACAIAFIVGFFIYREISLKDLPSIMIGTAISTSIITILIGMANLFGWMLSAERIPQALANWMTSLTESTLMFLLLINILLLLIGMVMDGIAALIILVPIFMPVIANFGIDPVHFGVIMCFNLTLGLLTPPVGNGLYIASSLGEVKMEHLVRSILPFLFVAIITLFILTYLPQLVLWIPSLLE